MEKGLIHIYTGEGKGKTSAGMGLLIRALGRGLNVKVIQLFKRNTGEQFFFENSGFNYLQFKPLHPFFKTYNKNELESLRQEFLGFWREATEDMNYDIILIDEIGPGVAWGVIDEGLVLDLIKRKPEKTELVMTGRDFPLSIIEKADYVSEINKIKHPYDKGILARKGIEF
ncbi:MAG: ATP:corrinoid adenosyltransferase [Berkelbacteria bacterium GW2011_GWA1_36_9]|uniref:ATP:corrinoid adenosyltransferase n=1 Tax=Berkelbacteria bacterium GW2011_GWA1_36_9 TaxID=1618331 RepID=A0A0G0FIL4_9BACT|nr:MAG: ATP:corrinoid adenosyltransferase [Berkelbacteria bacterium GW2011_GWA1_36_9]